MKTTAEMIEVMQAFERGEAVEICDDVKPYWYPSHRPAWDWQQFDYRIKPKLIEGWVNAYDDGSLMGLHKSREEANEGSSGLHRIRCVKVREVSSDD
jgi:hypothetical protein